MSRSSDVIVIGGGLAGRMAALAAADEGATVRLLSRTPSTLEQASGLIDILGYVDGDLVADPYDALDRLPAGHPYERVGPDTVRAAMELFDRIVPGYRGHHTDRNALVPTFGGRVKPTGRYPEGVARGVASTDDSMLLVGFPSLPEFHAPSAADRLAATGVPFRVRGVTVPFPISLRDDATITRLARALETNERTDDGSQGVCCRSALARAIAAERDGEARIGLPALLGERSPDPTRQALADELDAAVFEVPTGPPSLLGRRLERLLSEALADAGVLVEIGNAVTDFDANDGRIENVVVDRSHRAVEYAADEFVLATGGLVGKGIRSDRVGVTEPVFGCDVAHPADRYEWSDAEAFGEHAFATFGVDVDRSLHPVGPDGTATYSNLRAAGAVIGGADFAAEKSGSGISVATGYRAGRAAAGESG